MSLTSWHLACDPCMARAGRFNPEPAEGSQDMKTLFGMAIIAVPSTMAVTGVPGASVVTAAGLVGLGCWLMSGWLSD